MCLEFWNDFRVSALFCVFDFSYVFIAFIIAAVVSIVMRLLVASVDMVAMG